VIDFARETLFDVVADIEPLLRQHYEELTLHKDRITLDPMWGEYKALEDLGRFALFTAREDGELVGYAAFFLVCHLHYAGTKMAINDVLFLRADKRRGTTGIKLLKFCEQALRELGTDKLTYHVKHSLDWSAILHRMGYADEEKIVGKML
jgi:hypothetical protein